MGGPLARWRGLRKSCGGMLGEESVTGGTPIWGPSFISLYFPQTPPVWFSSKSSRPAGAAARAAREQRESLRALLQKCRWVLPSMLQDGARGGRVPDTNTVNTHGNYSV
jgi:hypothetical protein